jgi:hypothetical protein
MTASRGNQIVDKLRGDELFSCDNDAKKITARDLRAYLGGDRAAPAIRPEGGAHPVRASEFPNAEHAMQDADRILGLQDGLNVNFSKEQITRLIFPPTFDPHVPGALWNDNGTPKISEG